MALTIPNTIADGINTDGSNIGANFNAIQLHSIATDLRATTQEAASLQALSARFKRATNYTVTKGTSHTVEWETVTNDIDGWYNAAHPSYLTCPATGVYLVTLHFDFGSGNGYLRSYFLDNDAVMAPAGTPQHGIEIDSAFDLSDTVELRASKGEPLYLYVGTKFKVTNTEVAGTYSKSVQNVNLIITRLFLV